LVKPAQEFPAGRASRARHPGREPSASSIYRLEQGVAIRASNARRLFDVINAALNNTLDPSKELKVK